MPAAKRRQMHSFVTWDGGENLARKPHHHLQSPLSSYGYRQCVESVARQLWKHRGICSHYMFITALPRSFFYASYRWIAENKRWGCQRFFLAELWCFQLLSDERKVLSRSCKALQEPCQQNCRQPAGLAQGHPVSLSNENSREWDHHMFPIYCW